MLNNAVGVVTRLPPSASDLDDLRDEGSGVASGALDSSSSPMVSRELLLELSCKSEALFVDARESCDEWEPRRESVADILDVIDSKLFFLSAMVNELERDAGLPRLTLGS